MTQERVILISPEGDITFLTHGDDDLAQAGNARIIRASHIRFSNSAQKWFVYLRFPSGMEQRIDPGYVKRSEALAEEVRLGNKMLAVLPDMVEDMIEKAGVTDVVGDDSSG